MTVIVHLRVPGEAFELGRILRPDGDAVVVLETAVPLGGVAVPFFSVRGDASDGFEEAVRSHPAVTSIREVGSDRHRMLYALEWRSDRDRLFTAVRAVGATVVTASATAERWKFELRFPGREAVTAFRERCVDAGIPLDVGRVYSPATSDGGTWYGLTEAQRRTLSVAVRRGYYAIPREVSTQELADEFDVSDQAVTERLRRAIVALARSTIVAVGEERDD